MFKSKCGCPDCKGEKVPMNRRQWKSRKNSHGNYYGSFRNPTAKHHGRRPV